MLDKCCVFNYQSNYDKGDFSSPTRKKMILDSLGLETVPETMHMLKTY